MRFDQMPKGSPQRAEAFKKYLAELAARLAAKGQKKS